MCWVNNTIIVNQYIVKTDKLANICYFMIIAKCCHSCRKQDFYFDSYKNAAISLFLMRSCHLSSVLSIKVIKAPKCNLKKKNAAI